MFRPMRRRKQLLSTGGLELEADDPVEGETLGVLAVKWG